MKHLILFFPSDTPVSSAFEGISETMILREMQMLSKVPQNSVGIYMVRNKKNFFGKNIFLPDFQLFGGTWEPYMHKEIVTGDLVYGFRMPQGVTHTYPSKIHEITKDKTIIENLFPEYSLNSVLCNNYEEISKNYTNISSQLKVLKPVTGSLGKGIFIRDVIPTESEFQEDDFPYLLQEFHDTSGGFYGLCRGIHDFRVVILDGKIIAKILREPAEKKYISNTFMGGTLTDIWDFNIPGEIQKVIDTVDRYCSKYEHRYYSIDLGLGINGEVKIFEINGAPGFANKYMAETFGEHIANNILQV